MNNLKVGQVFKNYKAICEWLEVKPASGNTKIAHMKDFDRYCKYHKDGNKFVIDEVYDVPLERENNRYGNSEYCENLEPIILHTLKYAEDYHIKCSVGRALTFTNMVNKNFQFTKSNITDSCKVLEIDESYMYTFLNATQSRFKGLFETALKSLQRKKLIDYFQCIMVCKNISHIKYNALGEPIINDDGNVECTVEVVHEIATPDERRLITNAEDRVLQSLGYDSSVTTRERDCYVNGDWNTYRSKVNSIVRKELNISYYYKGYSMVLNKEGIDREIDNISKNRKVVNNLTCNAMISSSDKRINIDEDEKDFLIDILIKTNTTTDVRKLVEKMIKEEKKE